jgi:hypothetical protein
MKSAIFQSIMLFSQIIRKLKKLVPLSLQQLCKRMEIEKAIRNPRRPLI